MTSDIDPAVRKGIDAIEAAWTHVRTLIETGEDGRQGLAAATELVKRLDQMVGDAARLRGSEARKIKTTEELTLTQLAEVVGVSAPRASVMIRADEPTEGSSR